jgi:hypothetical protein
MRQILDHLGPAREDADGKPPARAARFFAALLRIASRAGAVAQLCLAVLAWSVLAREQGNLAILFWRREALIAALVSVYWLTVATGAERRQAAVFVVVNGVGWVLAILSPTLVS